MRTRAWLIAAGAALVTAPALAQFDNPVYVDDAPRAADALASVPELMRAGNTGEAVRALQEVLDESAERVLADPADPGLYKPVRARVHALLLRDPGLLDRYRRVQGPAARALLEQGALAHIERAYFLTSAGAEASLRLAQDRLESGAFDSAWRVLVALEKHPDRTRGSGVAEQAARMAVLQARYLDTDGARTLARRWLDEAGLAPDVSLEAITLRAPAGWVSPMASSPGLDRKDLLPTPMASAVTTPASDPRAWEVNTDREIRLRESADSWVFPAVTGDTLIVNDGRTVSAYDRFTLGLLWRAAPEPIGAAAFGDERRFGNQTNFRPGRAAADTTSVTVQGRVAVAATGVGYNQGRDGDMRVHGIELESGRVLWSRWLAAISDELAFAVPRGPAVISGDTAVVVARKFVQARRLVSTYMVGLDLWSGEPRWVRLIGSAGSMPFQSGRRPTPAPTLDGGVVYLVDDSGVIAAVEAESGRPRWVRRFRTETAARGQSSPPFSMTSPIVHDGKLIALAPAGDELVVLDATTGARIGSRGTRALEWPEYLVRVGDRLAAVSDDRVAFLPLDGVLSAAPALTRGLLVGRSIAGRAVAAGDRLLLPMTDAVLFLDPRDAKSLAFAPVRDAGNVTVVDGQVVVTDATSVHSHLVWSVASAELSSRLDANPGDPGPAVTLAELAFRSGEHQAIVPAADRALAAIERDPLDAEVSAARARLHMSLRSMVHASEAPKDGEPVLADAALVRAVVERMGRSADSPGERVAYLLALGGQLEAQGDARGAVEAYQTVLGDRVLGETVWRGPRVRARAAFEATRRVRALVRTFGASAYETFDADAQLALAALDGRAGAGELEAVAMQYPASALAGEVWTRAARAHERAGRARLADAAWKAAVESASLDVTLGRSGAMERLRASAVGRIAALESARRLRDAADLITSLEARHGPIDFGVDSELIAQVLLAAELRPAAIPLVGTRVESVSARLEGWSLRTPIMSAGDEGPTDRAVLHSRAEGALGVFVATADGGMELLWSVAVDGLNEPDVVRLDARGLLLFHPTPSDRGPGGGGSFELLDAASGQSVWRTDAVHDLLGERPAEDSLRTVVTPLEESGSMRDVLLADVPGKLIVVERTGRAASIDPETGRVLWTTATPVERVYDVDARGGVLAIIGEESGPAQARVGLASRMVTMSLETGRVLRRDGSAVPGPRWVRVARDGRVIAGVDGGIVALGEGGVRWTLEDELVERTAGGWVLGEAVIVRATDGSLRRVDLESGRLDGVAIRAEGRVAVTRGLQVHDGGDELELLSPRGLVVLDGSGELVGVDGLAGTEALVTPVRTQTHYMALDRRGLDAGAGEREHPLYVFGRPDGRLAGDAAMIRLRAPVHAMAAVDGRLLVTTGWDTVVLSAPADAQ